MVGRFVAGIGTGIETSTVPMWQAELCEASKRGKLVCSEPLLVGVGIVIRFVFPLSLRYHHADFLELLLRFWDELCRWANCVETPNRLPDAVCICKSGAT